MTARRPLVLVNGQRKQLPTGDTLAGVVHDTDPRLTDAREWTATTVTQAEAEAGTATTRRAWTAQRVFQAVAAWWSASAMKTKLDGIAAGATANATDAQLRDRSTHTGTQAISTVTGLQTVLDGKINASERGVSGGIPTLDEFARIPPSQLPSYVDDVLEFATTAQFPTTGEGGKIYIAINQGTAANPTRQYRWTGSVYAEINPSPGTTDALTEGSTNLYFNESRVRNTVLTGLSLASSAAVAATDTILTALGKIQARLNLLGTAANANVQSSPTDTTAGALMAVGAGGLLGPAVVNNSDLDAAGLTATYFNGGVGTNRPPGFNYGVLRVDAYDADNVAQTAYSMSSDRVYFRRKSGSFAPWQELWHTGNLVKQTSPTDTTAGALMAVGAFGLGGYLPASATLAELDTASGNRYLRLSGYTGGPFDGTGSSGIQVGESNSWKWQLLAANGGSPQLKFRVTQSAATFGEFVSLFHTGNFNPATKQDKSAVVSTATTRTLALTDAWNYVRPGTTSAITLTVPTSASVAFEIGTEITIRASGNITLAAASGVTLNAPSGGTLSMTARMTVTLKKVATDVWDVIGQTVAA